MDIDRLGRVLKKKKLDPRGETTRRLGRVLTVCTVSYYLYDIHNDSIFSLFVPAVCTTISSQCFCMVHNCSIFSWIFASSCVVHLWLFFLILLNTKNAFLPWGADKLSQSYRFDFPSEGTILCEWLAYSRFEGCSTAWQYLPDKCTRYMSLFHNPNMIFAHQKLWVVPWCVLLVVVRLSCCATAFSDTAGSHFWWR